VVSPEEPYGTELLLEPNANPGATYQRALFEAGIPLTSFEIDDFEQDCHRLTALGVVFTSQPTNMGDASVAVFEDTCGKLIQIHQTS